MPRITPDFVKVLFCLRMIVIAVSVFLCSSKQINWGTYAMLCVTERDFRVGPCCGHKPEDVRCQGYAAGLSRERKEGHGGRGGGTKRAGGDRETDRDERETDREADGETPFYRQRCLLNECLCQRTDLERTDHAQDIKVRAVCWFSELEIQQNALKASDCFNWNTVSDLAFLTCNRLACCSQSCCIQHCSLHSASKPE